MFYLTISHTAERTPLFYLTTSVYFPFSLSFQTHTHTNTRSLCQRATNMLFLLVAKGWLTLSLSWDMVINKVMLPF